VYVFNAFPFQDWQWRPVDLELGDTVSSIWVQFAKTGTPNGAPLPEWPAYDPKSEILMNFGDTPKAQPAPLKESLDFIAEWTARRR
jgi:para-nitrobenzyl esterase